MDFLKFLILVFLLTGCAKFEYIIDQSVGQISLLAKGVENKKILKSVRVTKDQKDKIVKIEELKKYFYKYWQKKETEIYSKTTILKNKAVSYLVIGSPFNEIRPIDNCFPLMGCFPYLGFFDENDAQNFAKNLEKAGDVAYIRPVYAYSTLGYFTDTILSSFFQYSDYELAELIFHELFHTIFFVKDEVDLNENLANYFSKKMLEEYFLTKGQLQYLKIQESEEVEDRALRKLVMNLAFELNELYHNLMPKNKTEAEEILFEFVEKKFRPKVLNKCHELKIIPTQCTLAVKDWNNAKLAAFLTYEKNAEDLESLQRKLNLNLLEFYQWMEKKYIDFKNQSEIESFSKFIF